MSLHQHYLNLMDQAKQAPTPELQSYFSARAELLLMEDRPDFYDRLEVVNAFGTKLALEAAWLILLLTKIITTTLLGITAYFMQLVA